MKYNEFFSNFYMGRTAGGIVGHKSKEKIPEYIMRAALPKEQWAMLPTSNSTYGKWLEGTRTPDGNLWGVLSSDFNEEGFTDSLSKDLNDNTLGQVMINFRIPIKAGSAPDKKLLAFALAKIFHAIAYGNGETTEEAKDYYRPDAHIKVFPQYQERAIEKYSKVRLPFTDEDDERLMDEIYVCNNLSSRIGDESTGRRSARNRSAIKVIDDATLDKIAEYDRHVALIAIGGMGKSMMLQHLFYESIKEHDKTGLLPILVELRDFSEENNLFTDYILRAVSLRDDTFTEQDARDLMSSGKCQILLDAADEIDQSDVTAFQRQLFELMDQYPHNQYVIASRECEMIRGLRNRFKRLYLKAFEGNQPEELIRKLLPAPEDEELRENIDGYLKEDFIQKHNIFRTNPMMLTFVIMKFPLVETYHGQKHLFYHEAYETMVTVHDREKEAYDRIYHSAHDSAEFTMVFREFCAITYRDRIHEFGYADFEEYFNKLTTVEKLNNKKIMTKENFIHDACATACMMYEADYKFLYIDPGFQEYLFAEYNRVEDPAKTIAFGKQLWTTPIGAYEDGSAFDMFCEFSMEKVELTYFMPLLNEVFKGKSDDDAFVSLLKNGYHKIDYQVVDTDLVAQYMVKEDAEWQPLKPSMAEPSNVVFSMILKQAGVDGLLCFAVFEDALNYPDFMTAGIFGEDFYDGNAKKRTIVATRVFRSDVENLLEFEKRNQGSKFIRDDESKIVCFGHEYKADFTVIEKTPGNYQSLIEVLKTKNEDVWQGFCRIKAYYKHLMEKHAGKEIYTEV